MPVVIAAMTAMTAMMTATTSTSSDFFERLQHHHRVASNDLVKVSELVGYDKKNQTHNHPDLHLIAILFLLHCFVKHNVEENLGQSDCMQ
jgi:hypothetical protein